MKSGFAIVAVVLAVVALRGKGGISSAAEYSDKKDI